MIALSVLAALSVGFMAGLWTFKIKQRWCGACGLDLCCPRCGQRPPAEPSSAAEWLAPLRRNP